MEEILKKLNDSYTRLQSLSIQPTVSNMETLLQSLYDLKDVYNRLKEKEGAENEPDISRRNDD